MNSKISLPPPGTDGPVRPTRRHPQKVDGTAVPVPTVSAEFAREQCREDVGLFISGSADGGAFRLIRRVPILAYPPGIGKTSAVVDAVNNTPPEKLANQVLIVAPTHELLDQYESRLKVPSVHIRGRTHPGYCAHPELAERFGEKNLPMSDLVCEKVCPHRSTCMFYQQFEEAPEVVLVTSQMARSPRFRYAIYEGARGVRRWSRVVYDDLNPVAAFADSLKVSLRDLLFATSLEDVSPASPLLSALITLIASSVAVLRGPALWEQIEDAMGEGALIKAINEMGSTARPHDPSPDLPSRRVPSPEEVARARPRFVELLWDVLLVEGHRHLDGVGFNGRLTTSNGVLTIRTSAAPEYTRRSPVMVLNSTPDLSAWRQIFGLGMHVSGDAPVEMPDQVTIVQYGDWFSGKGALARPKHLDRRFAQIDQLLPRLEQPVVVVSFLSVEDQLTARLGELGVRVQHYWSLQGRNDFQSCRSLIVLGCPTPAMDDGILGDLEALYVDASPLETSPRMRPEPYITPQGVRSWEVGVFGYDDDRVDAALRTLREGELFQVIHRLRPLTRDEPLDIVILTEQPIPGVAVHLTAIRGVGCPAYDPDTKAVIDAVNELLDDATKMRGAPICTRDVALKAFGDSGPAGRKKVTKGGRLDEIAYHANVKISRVELQRDLNNGGRSRYNTYQFTRD